MANAGLQGGDQFEKDLLEVVDIADEFIRRERTKKFVYKAIKASALAGLGPGDKPYAPWSDEYEKKKKRASGQSRQFLWGIRGDTKESRAAPHMLQENLFKWRKIGKQTVELVWTAQGKTGDYAEAHNEGLGKQPKREWMHFDTSLTKQTIDDVLEGTMINRIKEFNKKHKRR